MCFEYLFIRLASSSSMGPITMLKHNGFISGHATLAVIFFFKEEAKQLYFPRILINALPDGHESQPFRATNSSESLDHWESL